jgi:ribosomal protein S18 acetylase RimI-like enzyme
MGDSPHVLDNPVWHALQADHARFARGVGPARSYDPEVAAFIAIERDSPAAWSVLEQVVGPDETVLLVRAGDENPPPAWTRLAGGGGAQMVLGSLADPPVLTDTIVELSADDVPQMLALVELTKPGPFRSRTIELGHYVGVKVDGQLVAMAGERLQPPGYTEISAVCTHPSARGRGLAAALSHHVATGILARGRTPLLHVAEGNDGARRVYERLGFVYRRRFEFVAYQTPAPEDGAP